MEPSSKTILMIALDFPPCTSAGVQRSLKFCKYLKKLGWHPVVLTVNEKAHNTISDKTDSELDIPVYRAFSFNSHRDFAIKGKSVAWLQTPDRWWTWYYTAVPLGKKLVEKYKPAIIWSTSPVITTHRIANKLSQDTNTPWIADFRDPAQGHYDRSFKLPSVLKKTELATFHNAKALTFTTQHTSLLYQSIFPKLASSKFHVIPNGFDPEKEAEALPENTSKTTNSKFTLLHSGAIYEKGRDPTNIFRAVSRLKQQKHIDSNNFELVFRGYKGNKFDQLVELLDISDLVKFMPPISYEMSLSEMRQSSALLVIQGSLFVNQVPGKLYEYLSMNLPIVCVCPRVSATHAESRQAEGCFQAFTENEISDTLKAIIENLSTYKRDTQKYSREFGAQTLNDILLDVLKEEQNSTTLNTTGA
jgi:glycosyltransferase involved in cell wall biosynthesis